LISAKSPFSFLPFEPEFQVALGQHCRSFGVGPWNIFSFYRNWRKRLPRADIPDHDRARAVVSFRNGAFEIEIRNRMIFDLHRQTLVGRIERWSLGNGPGFQHAFHF
jgi:hypothetical protein